MSKVPDQDGDAFGFWFERHIVEQLALGGNIPLEVVRVARETLRQGEETLADVRERARQNIRAREVGR